MAWFWPFSRADESPASFEKALESISTKIGKTQVDLERKRVNLRWALFNFTLYPSIVYIVFSIVELLVVKPANLGIAEWAGIVGGPFLIIVIRTAILKYYSYRIDTLLTRLKEQEKEREATINRLKAATKYDSTAAILAKYGGHSGDGPKRTKKGQGGDGAGSRHPSGNAATHVSTPKGRTGLLPPPTANIVRPGPGTAVTAAEHGQELAGLPGTPPRTTLVPASEGGSGRRSWQERLLEAIFGEDETLPQHRLALICAHCRMVNGLAAPGIVTMQEVGPWRCSQCFHMNNSEETGPSGSNGVSSALSSPGGPPTPSSAPPSSAAVVGSAVRAATDQTPSGPTTTTARLDDKSSLRRRHAKQRHRQQGDQEDDEAAQTTSSRSRSESPATPASTSAGGGSRRDSRSRSRSGASSDSHDSNVEAAPGSSPPASRTRSRRAAAK